MSADQVIRVGIRGLRSLADVHLDLRGLTVLLGENGAGKSSLLEGLQLLRRVGQPGSFIRGALQEHGGLSALLRHGATELELSVAVRGAGPRLEYTIAFAADGRNTVVSRESLDRIDPQEKSAHVLRRRGADCLAWSDADNKLLRVKNVAADQVLLTFFGASAKADISRMTSALERIRLHIPFDLRPRWAEPPSRARSMRDAITLEEGKELELLGWNLANCFHQLKSDLSRERWQRMLDMGRLGLGPDLEEITTYASGRGLVELRLHFSTLAEPVYASNLSDGQLAYLALLALGELGREYPPSLLAIDEPTANLHPNLAVRVAWLLEELAAHSPVVVATHSDRFLDALSEPQASAVLCELDASRSTQLRRPDASYLAQWLEDYRGLGALRAAGYESIVFSAPGAKP